MKKRHILTLLSHDLQMIALVLELQPQAKVGMSQIRKKLMRTLICWDAEKISTTWLQDQIDPEQVTLRVCGEEGFFWETLCDKDDFIYAGKILFHMREEEIISKEELAELIKKLQELRKSM